jgi:hypothetical protein
MGPASPDGAPLLEPELVPLLEPELVPLLEPELVPLLEPELDPLLEPELVPLLEPELDPPLEPELDPLLEPELDPPLEPELDPLLDPEFVPLLESAPQAGRRGAARSAKLHTRAGRTFMRRTGCKAGARSDHRGNAAQARPKCRFWYYAGCAVSRESQVRRTLGHAATRMSALKN